MKYEVHISYVRGNGEEAYLTFSPEMEFVDKVAALEFAICKLAHEEKGMNPLELMADMIAAFAMTGMEKRISLETVIAEEDKDDDPFHSGSTNV